MTLTDIDGVQFELDIAMIQEFHRVRRNNGKCTELITIMGDHLLVRESAAQIMALILKERQP